MENNNLPCGVLPLIENQVSPGKLPKLLNIAWISLFLGIIYDYLFYKKQVGISWPIYMVFVVAALTTLFPLFRKDLRKSMIWLVGGLLFFASMVFVRASVLLTTLNIIISGYLALLLFDLAAGRQIRQFLAGNYLRMFFLPLALIGKTNAFLNELLGLYRARGGNKQYSQVFKGILMSIPILILFLILLSSADLVFQKTLSGIFEIDVGTLILRTIIVAVVTAFFMGTFFRIQAGPDARPGASVQAKPNNLGTIETSILLSSVNVLFLIFIIVQITYLFGNEKNVVLQGFTYANYARRGFFELMAVAVFSFFLLWFIERDIIRKGTEHTLPFKIMGTWLIVQVITIMVSASMRLSLYESAYGFTTLRLYSHIFTGWLALVFIFLLYKMFLDNRETVFVFRTFISIIIFLAFMNFLNPDAFIVRKNIQRYYTSDDLDFSYVQKLSDDAIREKIRTLEITVAESSEGLRISFARSLYQKITNSVPNRWQSANLSRIHAMYILQLNAAMIEKEAKSP